MQNRCNCNHRCEGSNCSTERLKANFKPNDKIAVVACEKDGEVCCIMMIKAERFVGAVTKTLTPLIRGVTKQES